MRELAAGGWGVHEEGGVESVTASQVNMQTKLTLRLDEGLICRAKAFARAS